MKTILILLAVLLISYVIDWSFISNSITGYEIVCNVDSKGCKTLNRTIYRPNQTNQTVISKNSRGATTYKKCSIYNRKNWKCVEEIDGSEFGFTDGEYFYYMSPVTKRRWERSEYRQVSRIEYLYTKFSDLLF